jgi:hypothetical protein
MPRYFDEEWSGGPWSRQQSQPIGYGMPSLKPGDWYAYTNSAGEARFAARQQMLADGGPLVTMPASAAEQMAMAPETTTTTTTTTASPASCVVKGALLGVAIYLLGRWLRGRERA